MPAAQCFLWQGTVSISTGYVDCPQAFDAIDLSRGDVIRAGARLTSGALSTSSDILIVYLMNRWDDGVWSDRIAFNQILGNAAAGYQVDGELQKFIDINSAAERATVPPGANDSNHLTAGTTLDGPFPRTYNGAVVGGGGPGGGRGPSWKFRFGVTNVSGIASFPIELFLYCDSVER